MPKTKYRFVIAAAAAILAELFGPAMSSAAKAGPQPVVAQPAQAAPQR